MNSLILFAVVLAVVGGLIAHGGDRLGTYVGKKRMSLIGLRPRTTAMIYTIVSGAVIAVLSLLFLVIVDPIFKRALLDGPQLLYLNKEYRRQIKAEEARAAADDDKAQQATLQLQQAQSELQPIQQQLTAAQMLLQRSEITLKDRQAQLGLAQTQLATARVGLRTTDAQLRSARGDVLQAKSALLSEQARVQVAQKDVRREQATVKDLTGTKYRLIAYNTKLRKDTLRVLPRIEPSLRGVLVYRPGQEIGRVVIATDQPVTTIEQQLNTFLDDLGRSAEKLGIRPGRNNGRAVVIALPIAAGGDPAQIPKQEQLAVRALAQNIAEKSTTIPSVVVMALAKYNTFRDEQAGIELHPYDNALVYPTGAVIAVQTIDGAQSETQIFGALQDFLFSEVQPAVKHRGLIPRTDPQTGTVQMGEPIDPATSQALVAQIKQIGADAQVTASASADTYSSGPLHLRLSVAPAHPPPAPPSPVAAPVGQRL